MAMRFMSGPDNGTAREKDSTLSMQLRQALRNRNDDRLESMCRARLQESILHIVATKHGRRPPS